MNVEVDIRIPADHPALAGHFPGFPVVPGVVLLDAVLQAIADTVGQYPAPCQIQSAKFFSPVAPGEPLRLTCAQRPGGTWQFDIRAGGRRVASGTCDLTPEQGSLP